MRWWPGIAVTVSCIVCLLWVHVQQEWPFQRRNQTSALLLIVTAILLVVWWTFLSRAPNRLRLSVTFGLVGLALVSAALFRFQGVSGDLLPILEFRWKTVSVAKLPETNSIATTAQITVSTNASFPQFLGPNRDGVLAGPTLDTNWTVRPPQILWRQKVGAGWSGFAVSGNVAITQEQRGGDEYVAAYELLTGKPLWSHSDKALYNTVIAGEGPRATPTIVSNRVFTFGATGLLNCLDLATGKPLWSHDVVKESGGKVLAWGCASSPLVVSNLVIVHGGEAGRNSLYAYQMEDGKPAWSSGASDPSYASPILAMLAGVPQVLAFNDRTISSHNPTNGTQLWQRPWGNGNVVCSSPVIISSNRVLFSSGYGVGAELLEVLRSDTGKLTVTQLWKSIRMKAKFSHLFARDGFLYGLDDGVFACVDLKDGSQRWKEGRYGHGQGLVVDDYYVLMSEPGELLLLRPTPDAPNEIARFRVFDAKTWNPPALVDDLLLVRNDREAVCLRLAVAR